MLPSAGSFGFFRKGFSTALSACELPNGNILLRHSSNRIFHSFLGTIRHQTFSMTIGGF
jgi:hypothetical protein